MDNQLAVVIPHQEIAARLEQHAEQARGAYSANTERAWRLDIALFSKWCTDRGLAYLPASAQTVAQFIDDVGEVRKVASVRRYAASVAAYHRAADLPSPTSSTAVKLALKRLARSKGTRQDQAKALNREHVDLMLLRTGDALKDMRDRALLTVAYDSLCRRSELVSLDLSDLQITEDGSGTLLVRRSKGDQEGEGSMRFVAAPTVAALRRWLTAAGVSSGALFRSVAKGNRVGERLDGGTVARIFKRLASSVGLEPQGISGHSSRVGCSQDMAKHGFSLPEIMQAGAWKTPLMVAKYTERLSARNGAAAKLANIQNRV